jgi:hypothetical protein
MENRQDERFFWVWSSPDGAEYRRILSSTVGSDSLGQLSILPQILQPLYKNADPYRYDPICHVLSMELLQFYYSRPEATGDSRTVVARG